MMDEQLPPWLRELLITGGGLGAIGYGAKVWLQAWIDEKKLKKQEASDRVKEASDRVKAADEAIRTSIKVLQDRNERLEALNAKYGEKLESILVDMIAEKEEAAKKLADRWASDNKVSESSMAAAEALKANSKIMIELKAIIEKFMERKP